VKRKIEHIKSLFQNNQKVAENYFFMTFSQGAGLIISLLLYPYLIRTLGADIYGTYVFIFSNIQLFLLLIGFGFYFPALKKISLHPNDKEKKSQVVSEVFTAKIYLFILCSIILAGLILTVPFVRENAIFYIIIFSTLLIDILFPSWYFQGIQKMKFVTYVNLSLRILTIPLIFIFVKSPVDLLKFVLIVSLLPLMGGIFTFFYLQTKEKIKIRLVSIISLKPLFVEAIPFFWSSAFGTIKSVSVTTTLGIFFNMESVALWDLAHKIIQIPRMIISSINSALFPNVIQNYSKQRVKKIMRFEIILSFFAIVAIVLLGYWAVLLLGGESMMMAYPLVIVLSFTFFTWLLVGCYINFIFIPQDRNDLVFKCKLVEVITLIVLLTLGVLFFESIIFLVAAVVLSELIETVYCFFVTRKYKMLK